MAINFDVTSYTQIACKIVGLRELICKKLYLSSREVSWIRLTGLPVGALMACLESARFVSLAAEAVFKGVCNILGSPFSDRCSFLTGLKFTFITPASYLACLPVSLVINTVEAIIFGYKVIKNPIEAYILMVWEYDNKAYLKSELRINVDELSPEMLCNLGYRLLFGNVTDAKLEEAQRLFEGAVERNHALGYKGLADVCSERGLRQASEELNKKFLQAEGLL